jgi:mannose/fructose/N-acetylgalactosamine-specific phosphotransferase system component IIC
LTFHGIWLLFTFMQTEFVLIALLGGVVALDNTEAFQTMLSQPLLVGPAVGFLLSDPEGGLRIGVLLQLAYLWVMPIGTAGLPDPSVGSLAGCAGYVLLGRLFPDKPHLLLFLILLFTISFSQLCGWALILQRRLNRRLLPEAEACAEKADTRGLSRLFLWGLWLSFLRGIVLSALGLVCVLLLLKPLMNLLNAVADLRLPDLQTALWGWGIGTMIYLFGRKGNLPWTACGLVLGVVLLLI